MGYDAIAQLRMDSLLEQPQLAHGAQQIIFKDGKRRGDQQMIDDLLCGNEHDGDCDCIKCTFHIFYFFVLEWNGG